MKRPETGIWKKEESLSKYREGLKGYRKGRGERETNRAEHLDDVLSRLKLRLPRREPELLELST